LTISSDFFTPKELAERWRGVVKPQTLALWRRIDTGPKFIKVGNRILYPLAEVTAYENSSLQS
jgi:hypothetical protein